MKKFVLVLLLLFSSAVSSFAVTIYCPVNTCSYEYKKFDNVRSYKIDQNGLLTFITKYGQTIITSNYTIFLDK